MELLKKPDLVERYWDFLLILEANDDKGMTTSEVVEYSKITGIYDMSVDNNVASKVASDMRLKKGLLEVSNKKHYLSTHGKKALEARRQKDTGLTASNLETPAIVLSEADALSLDTVSTDTLITGVADCFIADHDFSVEALDDSFDFAPSIPPVYSVGIPVPYVMGSGLKNGIAPKNINDSEDNSPTIGELNAFINGKPEESEEIEIFDVEQTMVKNGKYPPIDKLIEWLDAEMAAKTVFIEDKGRKIALLNKIASFPLFDEEVREKLHEIAVDLEKLTDVE